MDGDFKSMQPSFNSRYVLIDWETVLSPNPKMAKHLFNLLMQMGFSPKVTTYRKSTQDNNDIFNVVDPNDVLFSNNKQKKDSLSDNNIKLSDVSYWIDGAFENIVDKSDLSKVSHLLSVENTPVIESKGVKYVMIDWDETMSLKPDFTFRFFALFEEMGFVPKIFTARNETSDNSDLLLWVDEKDILFADREQKMTALVNKYNISRDDVAFWLDDSPVAVIDKKDVVYNYSYFVD